MKFLIFALIATALTAPSFAAPPPASEHPHIRHTSPNWANGDEKHSIDRVAQAMGHQGLTFGTPGEEPEVGITKRDKRYALTETYVGRDVDHRICRWFMNHPDGSNPPVAIVNIAATLSRVNYAGSWTSTPVTFSTSYNESSDKLTLTIASTSYTLVRAPSIKASMIPIGVAGYTYGNHQFVDSENGWRVSYGEMPAPGMMKVSLTKGADVSYENYDEGHVLFSIPMVPNATQAHYFNITDKEDQARGSGVRLVDRVTVGEPNGNTHLNATVLSASSTGTVVACQPATYMTL